MTATRCDHTLSPNRRQLLKLGGMAGAGWLTRVAGALAAEAEASQDTRPTPSLIVLWMAGGPSQLETFDPHPGARIAADTPAIDTAAPGVQLAAGLERVAAVMESIALVRSMVSKEGDHERGTYLLKTGYRPDATVVHPAIGAVCCHQLPARGVEIPQHISILPGQWPARGGYLGNQYDAFKVDQPARRLADTTSTIGEARYQQRLADVEMLERGFLSGRREGVAATRHADAVRDARRLMTSEQLAAFDIEREPAALRSAYGATPFGRGCLAACRLVEVGVRCVEVTLAGWDSHANNHEVHDRQKQVLDPAFAALLGDLQARGLWDQTVVVCAGEFGRTPQVNRLGGRDHWPHGFSVALAGGAIRGGQVVGATDPAGGRAVDNPCQVGDLHATLLAALGLDPGKELISPIGRPLKLAEGRPIGQILRMRT